MWVNFMEVSPRLRIDSDQLGDARRLQSVAIQRRVAAMFKDILVPCVLGSAHEAAIRSACALAGWSSGHVIAVAGVSIVAPVSTAWAYYPAGVYATLHESAEATAKELGDAIRARLAREEAAHDVRVSEQFWMTPAEQSTLHARYSDLIVLGIDRQLRDVESRLFAGLLLEGGRPLLLAPPGSGISAEPGHAVIAWKETREAARALHDAMPLLAKARSVDLLMIEGGYKSGHQRSVQDVHMLSHLERHGLRVNLVRRADEDMSTGRIILAHAEESRADFIVAGGYGHPRALEVVFGGVTKCLFDQSPVPVLFSH